MNLRKLRLIFLQSPCDSPIGSLILTFCQKLHLLVRTNHRHELRSLHLNFRMRNILQLKREQIKADIDNAHSRQNGVPRKMPFKRRQFFIHEERSQNFSSRLFLNVKLNETRDSLIHTFTFANSFIWGQGSR